MTMTQCLDLSLRAHGPHASYELMGQCLLRQVTFFKNEAAASENCHCAAQLLAVAFRNTLKKKHFSAVPGTCDKLFLQLVPLLPVPCDHLPNPAWRTLPMET